MSAAPEEERFAKNTTILAQAVHEGVKRLYDSGYKTINPSMVEMAITMISSFDKNYLIQGFIENSHKHCWDNIKVKDEKFFVENAKDIFKYLPMDEINMFKDVFTTTDANGNSVVSRSLKNQIWDLLHAMVKISIKYIHKNRSPYSYLTDNGPQNAYGHSFFDEVDISHHANLWEVTLEFHPNY